MAEVLYGPMHLLVVGFKNPDFHGQIQRALGSAMEAGTVRLIDLRFVYRMRMETSRAWRPRN
ncbi:hypothetical protein [Methanoculleus sp. 10]|uniref:hypothetical protein n=1 Tax=Methanoculleus sp. 10 TaxID=430615 RepID=UPI001B772507|nr:hypothetical protein [Methanoculleus sp. 10]MBP7410283.1 hypothetical protein [Methanoculleus sp.]